MTHLLHHFRRNRTYSSYERWGVFAGMLTLTLAVTAGGWLLLGKPAVSASSLTVANIELTKDNLPATGQPEGAVTVTIADKETLAPVIGVWVGLRIADPALRTPETTYYDWYSPAAERAFFQTDGNGRVTFPLTSKIPGAIEYQIYAANPEMANDAKYQSLHSALTVTYTASDSPTI